MGQEKASGRSAANAWAAFEGLSMTEQNAFLAFFSAPWSTVRIFVGADGKAYPVSFGKAECEWVPFRETWQQKFPQLGLTTFEESEPKPTLGMAEGSTWTEAKIRVTEAGCSVREKFYAAVASAIEARRAETVQHGSVHEGVTAFSRRAQSKPHP